MVPARRSSTRSIPWPNGPAPYNRRAENISMAHHLDLEEQEQLDRLKHFWRAWGTPITSVLIVVAGAIAAWNGSQYWQNRQAAQAAALWDVADMAVRAGDQARMEQAFGDLKAKYPGTAQAAQAGAGQAAAVEPADGSEKPRGSAAATVRQLCPCLCRHRRRPQGRHPVVAGQAPAGHCRVPQGVPGIRGRPGVPASGRDQARRAGCRATGCGCLGGAGQAAMRASPETLDTASGRSLPWRGVACALLLAAVTGCSSWGSGSGSAKPAPADLGVNVPTLGVRQVWTARIGSVAGLPLAVHTAGPVVTLASADGVLAAIDARTGGDLWRMALGESLSAGVGSDGKSVAVVSRNNALIVVDSGRERWRGALTAQVLTAPLVAGGRVFVLAADRSVAAYDAATGRRLWVLQRPGEPLVLRQAGVLLAVGDTLVAGLSGRLVGIDPDNGSPRWEAPPPHPPRPRQGRLALGSAAGQRARQQRCRAPGRIGRPQQPGRRQRLRALLSGHGGRGGLRRYRPGRRPLDTSGQWRRGGRWRWRCHFWHGKQRHGRRLAPQRRHAAVGQRPAQTPPADGATAARALGGGRRRYRLGAFPVAHRWRAAEPHGHGWLGHRGSAHGGCGHAGDRHPQWRCRRLSA